MGPSPETALRNFAWHPLAPSTRNLSMIVFGSWTALPELEASFELTNLNDRYHAVQDATGGWKDAICPEMAAATVRRLKAQGRLIEGRTVICLGDDVDSFFRRSVRDNAGLHIVKAYHPSNLTAKGRKTTHGWQSDTRRKIRAAAKLPFKAFVEDVKRVELGWRDYGEDQWRRYANRYSLTFSDSEWFALWTVLGQQDASERLSRAEQAAGISDSPPWSEHAEMVQELDAIQEEQARSGDTGWYDDGRS